MAEALLQFQTPVSGSDESPYLARAVGAEVPGGNWQGWIEFTPVDGGEPLCSPRETTQPNRTDIVYWATGLSSVYLQGALSRAKTYSSPVPAQPLTARGESLASHRDGRGAPRARRDDREYREAPPRRSVEVPPEEIVASVLDPFSVYEKGETLLRRQLGALSSWHLVNIIVDYELSDDSRTSLNRTSAPALIETIVTGVQNALDESVGRSRRAVRS